MNEAAILYRIGKVLSAIHNEAPEENSKNFRKRCESRMDWLIQQMFKKNLKKFEVVLPEDSRLAIRSKQVSRLDGVTHKFFGRRIYSHRTKLSKSITQELVSALMRCFALANVRQGRSGFGSTTEERNYIQAELDNMCELAGYDKQLVN